MALKMAYSIEVFGQQLEFSNAYFMITQIFGNKQLIELQLTVFENQQKENVINHMSYKFCPSILDTAYNFYKQGYEYLKGLDEFKDSVDVLEDGQVA